MCSHSQTKLQQHHKMRDSNKIHPPITAVNTANNNNNNTSYSTKKRYWTYSICSFTPLTPKTSFLSNFSPHLEQWSSNPSNCLVLCISNHLQNNDSIRGVCEQLQDILDAGQMIALKQMSSHHHHRLSAGVSNHNGNHDKRCHEQLGKDAFYFINSGWFGLFRSPRHHYRAISPHSRR